MPTVKEAASTFLASKRIAVTGVSRKPQRHGGNAVYKRLRERGYQVFVVNPSEGEVEGDDEDLAVLLCSGTWCRRWARSATGSRTCAPQTSGQFSGTGGPSCAGSSRCRSASTPRSSGPTCRRCRARPPARCPGARRSLPAGTVAPLDLLAEPGGAAAALARATVSWWAKEGCSRSQDAGPDGVHRSCVPALPWRVDRTAT